MNLIARIAEDQRRLRPRSSPRPQGLPLDSIIQDDCVTAMAGLPDTSGGVTLNRRRSKTDLVLWQVGVSFVLPRSSPR